MKLLFRSLLFVLCITIGAPFAACNSTLFISAPSNPGGAVAPPPDSALFSLLGNPGSVQQGDLGEAAGDSGIIPDEDVPGPPIYTPFDSKMMTFTLTVPDTFSMAYIDHWALTGNTYTYNPGSPFQDEAPEPATWVLIAGALACLGGRRLSGKYKL
jgi:hypothetical protein